MRDMNLYRPSGKSAVCNVAGTKLHRYWECVKNRQTGCKSRLLSHEGILQVKCNEHNHPSPVEYIKQKDAIGAVYTMTL